MFIVIMSRHHRQPSEKLPVKESSESEEAEEYDDEEADVGETLCRMLSTEDGEPLGDVLKAISDSLAQQNKVLNKMLSVMDKLSKDYRGRD